MIEDIEIRSLCEMVNIRNDVTGLGYPIHILQKIQHSKHGPRVKIYPDGIGHGDVSISVSKNPEVVAQTPNYRVSQSDLNKAFDFVVKNYDVLIRFWNDQTMSINDVLDVLKKV